jgi:Ca2+-dependent lipid-binding protein
MTHIESTEWLNHILARVWSVYEPVLSGSIFDSVNEVLDAACPSFLSSIKLTTFTLGSEPPAILGAKVYPETDLDVIHLDLDLCFIPRQSTDDVIYPLRKTSHVHWSSKIVLAARFGKAFVGVDIPVLLQNISMEAKARIQMKLMSASPVIKIVQVCLLQPPKIDFILKPLKSLDLMDLPGLNNWLRSLISSTVSSVLVNPNMITINLDEMMNKARESKEKSIGVLKIIVFGAKIPKSSDYIGKT